MTHKSSGMWFQRPGLLGRATAKGTWIRSSEGTDLSWLETICDELVVRNEMLRLLDEDIREYFIERCVPRFLARQ